MVTTVLSSKKQSREIFCFCRPMFYTIAAKSLCLSLKKEVSEM